MNDQQRILDQILGTVKTVDAGAKDGFIPADIRSRLLERGISMGAWQVRGYLTALEHAGYVAIDDRTARWHLTEAGGAAGAGR